MIQAEVEGIERLLGDELPASYLAAHLSREDEEIFKDTRDKDVRRSIRVGEVPMPELAPDEVLVAVMASAINYNTVWSAIFEPISTFRFLERLASTGGWDARHDLPYHVIGSDAAGVVVRVGVGVRRWSVGDRVAVSPGWTDDQDPPLLPRRVAQRQFSGRGALRRTLAVWRTSRWRRPTR